VSPPGVDTRGNVNGQAFGGYPVASVFFLTKLKDGADRAAYEKWVDEYDYPTCRKHFKSIRFYQAYAVNEISAADSPYDFIEHIDMTSFEEYQAEMETPEFQELLRQWGEFIDGESARVIFTDAIGSGVLPQA